MDACTVNTRIDMEKSQRMRFTIKDDISLLKGVAEFKPFEDVTQWHVIQQHLAVVTGKCYSQRTLKEHVDHLLKLFIKNDLSNLRKSGTERQYEEKEQLLQELKVIWSEYKSNNNGHQRRKTKSNRSIVAAIKTEIDLPVEYDTSLSQDEEPLLEEFVEIPPRTASPNSASNTSTLTLQNSSAVCHNTHNRNLRKRFTLPVFYENLRWDKFIRKRNILLQEKKLTLEERRLKLEEDKFELEKKERESRLRIELKERENNILISQQQQNIINFFIKNFKKD